jgi:hypothetical protein
MPSASNSADIPLCYTRNLQRQSAPGERRGEPGSLPSGLELEPLIVQAAQHREPALDFQTAHAASLLGVSDSDVLGRAEREGGL